MLYKTLKGTPKINMKLIPFHADIAKTALNKYRRHNLKWGNTHVKDQYFICMMVRDERGNWAPSALHELVFQDYAASLRSHFSTDQQFKTLLEVCPAAAGALEDAPANLWSDFKKAFTEPVHNFIKNPHKDGISEEAEARCRREFIGM